jgi:CHAD domain-containing protein
MAGSYLEREDKFDVDAGFVVPDLQPASPLIVAVRFEQRELRSEYFDTADAVLLNARMTLRHRTGTHDAGWQLKVPHESGREEIRLADEGQSVPGELTDLLLGVRRGQPLAPVAILSTSRAVMQLLDEDGQVLAEVADDTVHAAGVGDTANLSSWRELEVELGSGDPKLLRAVGRRLVAAGAQPSASKSKLSRAVHRSWNPAGPLQHYLLEQQQAILAGDLALRRGDDSVIHQTRVATRRYRSMLRDFAPLLAGAATPALDGELRWYAGVLGAVRDLQVMQQRLLGMVDRLPDRLVLGPVRARISAQLMQEQAQAWQHVQQVLTGERYLALLEAISQFTTGAPAAPSRRRLRTLMIRADRTATKRLRKAARSGEPSALHRARKAAKRARYAGESLVSEFGGKARKQVKRNKRLQTQLGEHQDSLVSSELLLRLASIAGTTAGENGFTFGVLYEMEQDGAARIRAKLRRSL